MDSKSDRTDSTFSENHSDGEPRSFSAQSVFFHPRWPVLYEDNHLLALYKPAGLLVQGDRTGDPSLLELGKAWLKIKYRKPGNVFLGLVHRLDRPVSGVVLFAKTSKAASRLSASFREKRVRKEYLAVVEKPPPGPAGRLVHWFRTHAKGSMVFSRKTGEGLKKAELEYRIRDRMGNRTLLEITLVTGRKHQIRAQLAHEGCPILGDVKYGAEAPLPGRTFALHAWRLTVPHPTRKIPVVLACPLPEGWPWPVDRIEDDEVDPEFHPLWLWSDYPPMAPGENPQAEKA